MVYVKIIRFCVWNTTYVMNIWARVEWPCLILMFVCIWCIALWGLLFINAAFTWLKINKLVHTMWGAREEWNDQKVCAVSPTGENTRLLRKLPVCQNLYSHKASFTLTKTINNHVKRDHKYTMLSNVSILLVWLEAIVSHACHMDIDMSN